MQCESCHAEIGKDGIVCPQCGAPAVQNIPGFPNTPEIQKGLKAMITQFGEEIMDTESQFVGLLNDFVPEYDKERNLLKSMFDAGIYKELHDSTGDQLMTIMKIKERMLEKMFLSENAVEFVLACFTYMLGWVYDSPLRIKETPPAEVTPEEKKKNRLLVESKVYRHGDAMKHRLAAHITIPEGYTKVEESCFDKFGFLKSINMPSTMLAIGEYAFSECKRLRSVILPDTLKFIRKGAFFQCAQLTDVTIPESVVEIEDDTFGFCTSLERMVIPPSVGNIGSAAFSGCESLRRLIIPETVKFIESDAFDYCSMLMIRCYENSYVHKYCLANKIRFEALPIGTDLTKVTHLNEEEDEEEEEAEN